MSAGCIITTCARSICACKDQNANRLSSLYDKVNRCIVSMGAFVTEVFQTSNVYFMGELHEGKQHSNYHYRLEPVVVFRCAHYNLTWLSGSSGDQIIEWNGVNLCNRSDQEVQQILLSQFSDDEVEIVYLPAALMELAYEERHFRRAGLDSYPEPGRADSQLAYGKLLAGVGGHDLELAGYPAGKQASIRRKLSLSSLAHIWSK